MQWMQGEKERVDTLDVGGDLKQWKTPNKP